MPRHARPRPGPQVSQPLVPLVDEFARRLFAELDYVAEGHNAERFRVCAYAAGEPASQPVSGLLCATVPGPCLPCLCHRTAPLPHPPPLLLLPSLRSCMAACPACALPTSTGTTLRGAC